MLFLINLPKRSISVELAKFFNITEEFDSVKTVSKSAFCQARKNLDHKFFIDWNKLLLKEFYTDNEERIKRWNGFRLMANDGSTVCLNNTPEVIEHFGVGKNEKKSFPMARLHVHYDVFNHLSYRSVMSPYLESESEQAIQALDELNDDMLTIYERIFRICLYLSKYFKKKAVFSQVFIGFFE